MKRKTPPTNRAGTESLSFETAPNTTIIDLDNSDKDQSELTIKHSWVWNHFKVSPDSASAVCQVVRRGGIICATQLKRDKSGSTKNFHGHLLKIHQLAKPKLLKKTKKSSHIDMEKWSKSGGSKKIKVQLNNESLNNAIVYFLAECDLSFSTVERKSFQALVHLLNEGATPLLVNTSRFGISTHLARVFLQSQKTLKLKFIAKQDTVSFTTDAWTAPNVTAFMAVTAHYLDLNFKMKDLTLAVPHIQGAHTGKMFAHLFYDLLKKFGCIDKIHTITADNASTNNKMAQELSLQIQSFNPATHLLGCVAHVINLAAQAGIAALGTLDEAEEGEELSTNVMGASTPINEPAPQPTQNLMGINFMTTKPNGVNINDLLATFCTAAKDFHDSLGINESTTNHSETQASGPTTPSLFAAERKTYPTLSRMARKFLSIPATSAASEHVFSKGQRIVSWQQSALKPQTVKQLLCLKGWYQSFDGPF
ncbi:hypothetical protein MJO28_006934 [Puccinia striiformis f. sp. tritici]|uniref:Uncharacterized protein n=1 Tax=Puccinia striiformis f. sp. tritici TaxID=168172 RepID=A0ACC0EDZ1_9BASI|nr:hypothetical protein MJO28_006934 [Puccinia striiformis f. sp. tritici]